MKRDLSLTVDSVMMQHSVQRYLCLLWGISVLFIPGTRSSNSTTEPTTQLNTSDVAQNATHKPAEMNVPTATRAAASPTVESQAANVSSKSNSSGVSAVDLVVMNTTAATGNSSSPRLHHTTTTAAEIQASHISVTTLTAKPTEDPQPSTTSSETTAPATAFAGPTASSAATVATTAAPSSLQPTSIAGPAATSSNTPSQSLTQAPQLAQNTSSPPVTMTTGTTNVTSEAPPVADTPLPATVTTKATSTTELSVTSELVSETQTHTLAPRFPHTTSSAPPNASASTNSTLSTTAFTSSAIGILIPREPKRLPVSTTKPLKSTPAVPPGASKSPATTEVQPCSTRGVAKQCLIVIASLAVLATIFIISTIILCTKLSTRKYKVKKRQQGTEMMCISSLLPERNYTYTRQRNPVSNGVLVMHTGGDSDEDGGDNLTLSSFLPDNDRIV